ncbi:M56 family metallopeptidase [Tundrisphaera sp. TA3]|uniref:M56 family metallopeptidase n=1 Tax=Tundrisphaera sp. TA3 TaxID=3435775 RepID=UPI003EBDD5AE
MTGAIGAWLGGIYLVATAVLIATWAAMRALRQPARRLFVARCGAVALAGLVLASAVAALPMRDRAGRDGLRPVLAASDRRPAPASISAAVSCSRPAPASDRAISGCEVPPAVDPPGDSGSLAGAVVVAFLIGSGVTGLWLLGGAWAAWRFVARTIEAPGSLRDQLAGVVGPGRRVPALRVGPASGQPFAIGAFRPTIVLPGRFAGGVGPDRRVEAALRHEWAHIGNGDLALLALLRWLMPVLFAHPAYWWLRRRVRADQEAMADAVAVRGCDRVGYAEALLAWARSASPGACRACAGSLGLWDRPGELRERVALILDAGHPVEIRSPLRWRLLVASAASAGGLALAGFAMPAEAPAPPPADSLVLCCPS